MHVNTLINSVASHLPASGRLGVAFSGGVDSATLLAIACDVMGADRVLAILAVSPSLAERERRGAHETAAAIGAEVVEITTHEDAHDAYRANDVDRCYFCKAEMFDVIDASVVAAHGLTAVAYGENADDAARPDRPGARAATEHDVLRPLAAAGLNKNDVRAIARHYGLDVADKPAAPCLASRVPHGLEVVPEKLAQIEAVEDAVLGLGFTDVRVRHHESIARIELPAAELPRAVEPETAAALVAAATTAGFSFATVDLKGIQSGALTKTAMDAKAGRPSPSAQPGAADETTRRARA